VPIWLNSPKSSFGSLETLAQSQSLSNHVSIPRSEQFDGAVSGFFPNPVFIAIICINQSSWTNVSTPDLTTYPDLLESLSVILAAGKLRAQQAVEHERLAAYHEVGRLLDAHFLIDGETPAQGEKLYERLAEDLRIAKNLLHDARRLYRWHQVVHARGQLGWTHYRILLRIPDDAARNSLESEAAEGRWTTRELETQVRKYLPALDNTPETGLRRLPPLVPLRGRVDVGRGVDLPPAGRVLDLGFTIYARPDDLGLPTVPLGDVIISREGKRYSIRATRSRKAQYYTYLAQVERVIDGDTLLLQIQPAYGPFVRERIRLRGIDTPELGTPDGNRAKVFVDYALADHNWIAITTTKPDAYDRYIADIFIPNENDHGQQIVDRGRYLNQMLVDEGLARRVEY